jgi:hypothetical protein
VIEKAALVADLRLQVRVLEADLLERAGREPEFAEPLAAEWAAAHRAERTAATYETWLDGEVTQAAAAWVLGTVFLRFCEDNELIEHPYLAGPGDRLAVAAERQQEFFERSPRLTDRDWIVAGFADMSEASPVAAGLFDRAHNPMWRITPSHEAAKELLRFWRTRHATGERVVHDFTDVGWDTRFLGELYQDLSDHAKKIYALLQTPEFVEEFILDLTLTLAIDEFGLEPAPPHAGPNLPATLRVIDPACGSGHFLLGAFRRLNEEWEKQHPAMERWTRIRRILSGLHGIDKNPFAVSIARFRLLLAVMKTAEVKSLKKAHEFPLNIAVGDSLLHGRGAAGEQGELFGENGFFTFYVEDVEDYIKSADILGANSYHVVVGNPPYITVKDKRENEKYRAAYRRVCSGRYALSVPFAARFFDLATIAAADRRGAGYVGQITANSFMKREFGKKLIEDFLVQKVELTHVIDTSGAYIPGHGTPTVIMIGRNVMASSRPIRTVQGLKGEPTQPEDPAKGRVWSAISDQVDRPGSDSEWVNVADLPRKRFAKYPWSLNGGGAEDVFNSISGCFGTILGECAARIGIYGMTHVDDVMLASADTWLRKTRDLSLTEKIVLGDQVRDWGIATEILAFYPYDSSLDLVPPEEITSYLAWLWPARTTMGNRATFSGHTYFDEGRPWYEWHQVATDHHAHKWTIAFAFVSTHNHFVLDRGGKVFKQTAPVIKLPEQANEDDFLGLLGVLNSSSACFWLKQVCHDRGNRGEGGGITSTGWERFYEFAGTKLETFPLPEELPCAFALRMDGLGQVLISREPSAVCAIGVPDRERLDEARAEHGHVRGQMITIQEELDWKVYQLYGLLTEQEAADLCAEPDEVPELRLGERAFEIVLARQVAAGETETRWFARHGSTPITEIPSHWPQAYQDVVRWRIEVIERRRDIALIERPECKRRWQSEPWEKRQAAALQDWLLDRCERRELWFAPSDAGEDEPRPMTVSRLADRLRSDADFVSVARLYAGPDADLAAVIADITDAEHVPFLAALRYKDTGLRKRAQWEQTWEKQRQEDATGQRLDIPVPPKYAAADFRKASYWSNRGKLDVPKERFISYPRASPDGDGSLLLGWAGWDHRQQAHALMTIIEDREGRDGWTAGRLVPLIAGLGEVMPWVRQWHGEVDLTFGMSPADAYASYLDDQMRRCEVSAADLAGWKPPTASRARRPRPAPAERAATLLPADDPTT